MPMFRTGLKGLAGKGWLERAGLTELAGKCWLERAGLKGLPFCERKTREVYPGLPVAWWGMSCAACTHGPAGDDSRTAC